MKGVFITLEGPEGSGKSTQARRLCCRLQRLGVDVVCAREPGGTDLGEAIRGMLLHRNEGDTLVPEAECLLFAASRAQLVREKILPALDAGRCVVVDRFADATTAYQGYGRGLDVERILGINAFAIAEAIPDLTVLLDLEVRIGFERIGRRNVERAEGPDRIEREEKPFHERVRQGYRSLAARWPERFHVVDAAADEDAVDAAIWSACRPLLGRRGVAGVAAAREQGGAS